MIGAGLAGLAASVRLAKAGAHVRLYEAAQSAGMNVFGGTNAPYIWLKTIDGLTSWEMFDRMLNDIHVVITPDTDEDEVVRRYRWDPVRRSYTFVHDQNEEDGRAPGART